MSKCPTVNCPETLAVHSRRKYCYKCRANMAYWNKKRPAEIVDTIKAREKSIFRLQHIEERRLDQHEALSQLRRSKRKNR